ncbi:MAG: carbamoyltransferase HypF [Nitrospira sp.]|nr:carbamoyltransferase HypF [Nitrospira sp.]
MNHTRIKILVRGIVQGVGFRPFVYSLAKSLNLKGFVMNSSKGVTIEIEGDHISTFIDRLTSEAPPLSQIMDVDVIPMPYYGYQDFQIVESADEGSFTLISPDVSICKDCFREVLDKNDRRYLYPFINCTNCGPRYTITKSIPYDRPNTTMSVFKMCADCDREYHNPEDRRFHAQPNACPVCGPHVKLTMKNESLNNHPPQPLPSREGRWFGRLPSREGYINVPSPLVGEGKGEGVFSEKKLKVDEKENPIKKTIRLLKEGHIVAIKGLGGFHLACDATNEDAVNLLRLRKRKSNKPFALMSPDVETIRKFCEVSQEEERLLISNKRPIVLLKKIDNNLPVAVSPNNPCIGFMLPYTPLHYLLFYYPMNTELPTRHSATNKSPHPPFAKGGLGGIFHNFDALVMTSGNLSEEPIVIDNNEAVIKLSSIADAFLIHNRDIFMRVDDSVVRVINFRTNPPTPPFAKGGQGGITGLSPLRLQPSLSFIRRSRGYVPDPIVLHEDGPEVLGCGADIKNVFTLTKGNFAIPSQHIGDMENYETLNFFEESLRNLKAVYRVNPEALAYDLHPGYLSTQWALKQEGMKKVGIQHHYAHVASVMAEKGMKDKVIGVSFDGTGYGTDGNLWGGEFLIADTREFKRAGHFAYIPLPGGEASVREPWRTATSYIHKMAGDEEMKYLESVDFIERYGSKKIQDILHISDKREFSPLSSGSGRLFDAVSAMIGVCDRNTFEGEAAIALESITRPDIFDDYPVDIKFRDPVEIDFSPTILRIIGDVERKEDKGVIASRFHNTIVKVIARVVEKLSSLHLIKDVVLCGGVFQNMYLLERTIDTLKSMGMIVHIHDKVPTNDAGISLGQVYIIRERLKAGIG